MKRGVNMNHISGKIEQLLRLQEALRDRYEKENKVLLKTIEAQKEQILNLCQYIGHKKLKVFMQHR